MKGNIKEDIKRIAILIKYIEEADYVDTSECFNGEDIQAIENILNRLEQDERVIEEMAKYIEDTVEEDICNKENCYADKYVNGHCMKCVNCIIDCFRKKCE